MDDRALLQHLIRGPATGDALARAAHQTRAAVWKRVQALRQAGVEIDARPGRGYALAQPLDLLEADRIREALSEGTRAAVSRLEVAWSLDSTNSELLRREAPAAGVEVLLAERQTGGRGRRGRTWASPLAAHLYLSATRRFAGGLARLGGLSLAAGVAIAEALAQAGFTGVRLKWPNDLVIVSGTGLRKLGGLLVEGSGEYAGAARAVVGVGVNVRMPGGTAASIDQPWCDLAALAAEAGLPTPGRSSLAAHVIDAVVESMERFDREGLAPFLSRYAAFDALAGEAVVVHAASASHTGVALGVAEDGALRIRLDDGREHRVHGGEVSVRRVAAA